MRLNHINLTVTDVPAAAAFLTIYFGLISHGGNAGMAVLRDTAGDDGMVLTLMKANPLKVHYPETFHVGFFVASRDDVNAVYASMRADGMQVDEPSDTGHSYGFYVTAPGGFLVEVGA